MQDRQRPKQDHGNRNRRYQSGAPVLKEQEHHDEDEQDCLYEGVKNLLHRQFDIGRIIDGEVIFYP